MEENNEMEPLNFWLTLRSHRKVWGVFDRMGIREVDDSGKPLTELEETLYTYAIVRKVSGCEPPAIEKRSERSR